jgi:VanZ family protein
MGVIFYLSSQTSSGEHPWWELVFRKLGHVSGYALLTALWWWALRGVTVRPLLIAFCISLAYACTDEFHQTFVSGRTGTPVDVVIDSFGMAIAVLAIRRVRRDEAAKTESGQDAGRPPKRAHLERA